MVRVLMYPKRMERIPIIKFVDKFNSLLQIGPNKYIASNKLPKLLSNIWVYDYKKVIKEIICN